MNEHELMINKLAQGLVPREEGQAWFRAATPDCRVQIMRALDYCLFQAHPTPAEIQEGIDLSGLKDTYSPCVVAVKKPLGEARQTILRMVGLDQQRGFELWLSVFSVADKRRRESDCKVGCSHEWHNL